MSDKHICIVDDDKDDIFLMSTALKRLAAKTNLHFSLSTFHSGQEAFSFFDAMDVTQNALPDCICLDLNMPGMNGIELLKLLRNMRHLAAVPIYLVTTAPNETTQRQAISFGANGTFAKPETMSGMQSMHRELLGIPE